MNINGTKSKLSKSFVGTISKNTEKEDLMMSKVETVYKRRMSHIETNINIKASKKVYTSKRNHKINFEIKKKVSRPSTPSKAKSKRNILSSSFRSTVSDIGKKSNIYASPKKKLNQSTIAKGMDNFLYQSQQVNKLAQKKKKIDKTKPDLSLKAISLTRETDKFSENPLVKKTTTPKREFPSIRASMQSGIRKRKPDKIERKTVAKKIVNKVNPRAKRNPSISRIVNKTPEIRQSRKRAKSVSYSMTRKSVSSDTSTKGDLITKIKERSKLLPPFDKAKVVVKNFGYIHSFAVNTHKGCVRMTNEDRVSILLNAQTKFKKLDKKNSNMQNCCFFSVFDGHGGISCCNFLKDNLHNELVKRLDVEKDINSSAIQIYKDIDREYLKRATQNNHNFAGSTANTVMVMDNKLIIFNTGDTRTCISAQNGTQVIEGSIDHKPDKLEEFNRIIDNGGELYRMSSNVKTGQGNCYFVKNFAQVKKIEDLKNSLKTYIFGPWRIKPGGLSVARSFGDLESKKLQFGTVIGPVTAEPEILEFEIDDMDFAFIACNLNS